MIFVDANGIPWVDKRSFDQLEAGLRAGSEINDRLRERLTQLEAERDAPRALLQEAREFIRQYGRCEWQGEDTGRDALLAKLEGP